MDQLIKAMKKIGYETKVEELKHFNEGKRIHFTFKNKNEILPFYARIDFHVIYAEVEMGTTSLEDDIFFDLPDLFSDFEDDKKKEKEKIIPNELKKLFIKEIEKYLKDEGAGLFIITNDEFINEIENFDLDCLFEKVKKRDWEKYNNKSFHNFTRVKEVIPGFLNKTMNYFRALEQELITFEEKDPTFSFHLSGAGSYYFYYEGYEGKIVSEFKNNTFHMKEIKQSESFIAKTPREIRENISDIMDKVYKSNRIKNIHTPPKRYFKGYFDHNNEEVVEKVHSALLTKINYKEIETWCVNKNKKRESLGKFPIKPFSHLIVYKLCDYYLLVDERKKSRDVSIGKTKKEIKEKVNDYLKNIQSEVKNSIEQII